VSSESRGRFREGELFPFWARRSASVCRRRGVTQGRTGLCCWCRTCPMARELFRTCTGRGAGDSRRTGGDFARQMVLRAGVRITAPGSGWVSCSPRDPYFAWRLVTAPPGIIGLRQRPELAHLFENEPLPSLREQVGASCPLRGAPCVAQEKRAPLALSGRQAHREGRGTPRRG
jgi:hypothetical protein